MSSYLSSLLTSTTSRYNNLRRALLSDEVDGDTEADSHISRVLRAYYIEKGRPFPQWLPADPHSGPQSSSSQYGQSAARQPGQAAPTRRGGGLSDLFDSPGQSTQPQQPMSLRRGGQLPGRGAAQPTQPTPAGFGTGTVDPYNTGESYSSRPQRPQPAGARPMQSTREGSFQSQALDRNGSLSSTMPLRSASGSGGTAQDRLKAKLWGAGRSLNSRDPYDRGSSNG